MTTLANFNEYKSVQKLNETFGRHWLYIGRDNYTYGLKGSVLGNPYVRKTNEQPGATVERYRRWLWRRIQERDEVVLQALRGIQENTVLVCWCCPEPCHGEVVMRAAKWVQANL